MPLVVVVVVAVGVAAVAVGPVDLAADDRATGGPDDGPRALVAAGSDRCAQQGADAGAGEGGGDLTVMLLFAGLGEGEGRYEGRGGEAGDQQ